MNSREDEAKLLSNIKAKLRDPPKKNRGMTRRQDGPRLFPDPDSSRLFTLTLRERERREKSGPRSTPLAEPRDGGGPSTNGQPPTVGGVVQGRRQPRFRPSGSDE